jgi:hypothetical protein
MFTSFLVLLTTAVVITGAEPPRVLASYKTIEACFIAANKHNRENAKELAEGGGFLSCVQVRYPV